MAFKNNYANEINKILSTKRTPDDDSFTLTIPEHKFKKNAEKFNFALRQVYDSYVENDVKMFHIILSLTSFFDMDWLVRNVLDRKIKALIKQEMQEEYSVKLVNRKSRTKPEACIPCDEFGVPYDVDGELNEDLECDDEYIDVIDDDDEIEAGI